MLRFIRFSEEQKERVPIIPAEEMFGVNDSKAESSSKSIGVPPDFDCGPECCLAGEDDPTLLPRPFHGKSEFKPRRKLARGEPGRKIAHKSGNLSIGLC